MHEEKGSALITVVLVILVLTMVGLAGVLFMTMEDRLSGNEKLTKSAIFAAEIGLRAGEVMMKTKGAGGSSALTTCLAGTPSYQPPGGGYGAFPVDASLTYQTVTMPGGAADILTYTVYVRNNMEDPPPANVNTDTDSRVNIVCVATAASAGGRNITKVLEEQLFIGGAGGGERLQKGGNMGSTGAAGIGGS